MNFVFNGQTNSIRSLPRSHYLENQPPQMVFLHKLRSLMASPSVKQRLSIERRCLMKDVSSSPIRLHIQPVSTPSSLVPTSIVLEISMTISLPEADPTVTATSMTS